jgi:hypothetical protein
MPTVQRIGRYRLFFFSGEGNEPMHVHVESDECYAKFWLHPVALATSVGYTAHELGRIRKLIEERRQLIEEKWNEHFSH